MDVIAVVAADTPMVIHETSSLINVTVPLPPDTSVIVQEERVTITNVQDPGFIVSSIESPIFISVIDRAPILWMLATMTDTLVYRGGEDPDWIVAKWVRPAGTGPVLLARKTNNPTMVDLTMAWTNRESLVFA